ncbi:hypothetical protein [Subsaximicrobium wynnwilliamsii]|nr:hypothetical protein [Subsaximicrobium wynnwilliamsii]
MSKYLVLNFSGIAAMALDLYMASWETERVRFGSALAVYFILS